MKNSIKLVLAILFGMILLTACTIKEVSTIIIDEKSDVTVSVIAAMNNEGIDSFLNMQAGNDASTAKEFTDAERWAYVEENMKPGEEYSDFAKEKYEEGEFKGYRISKNFGNIEKCTTTEKDIDYSKALETGKIFIKDGDTYKLILTSNSANEELEQTSETAGGADLSEVMEITFVVTLPVEATKNNATTVSDDKKTYIWDAVKADSIELEFKLTEEKPVVPEEKKWCNQFAIEIDAPKAGNKPATKAKALNDTFSIGKIYWTAYENGKALDKDVDKFEDKYEYGVKIMVSVNDGYDLRSDYFGMVNGNQAEMPSDYDKKNFYVSYIFESDKPVVWASASKWAVEELTKANEQKLIPAIFDKEDLTTNITRKEFAHVAVKLYEKISGNKALAGAENPFTDTDDVEVLKAYTLGITKGMSETTFEPDTLITREQMATMMTRTLSESSETINTAVDMSKVTAFADDNEISSWAKDSVYFMSNIEIIKGMGENKFGPKANASREQSLLISVRSADKFAK